MPHFLGWEGPHESCHPETAKQEKEKGTEAFKVKAYERAIECYTRAIHFDPTNEKLFGNRALCKLRLREPDLLGAVKDCTTALSLNPEWAKLWVRRAECLIKMKEYDDAMQDMKLGVILDPSFSGWTYYQQLLTELTAAVPDTAARLKDLTFDFSGVDQAEEVKKTLQLLNVNAESMAGLNKEEMEKLRQEVIRKLDLMKAEPNAEFDKMADAQVTADLRKLALAKTRLSSLKRTEAKWVISCSSIGRVDEETAVLQWMLNVFCADTGAIVATACTNLDPTAQAQWHMLAKAMVYPLSPSTPPQIPGLVIVANRLRRSFSELEELVPKLTTLVLQSAEEERKNAKANGTDPDGYNFDKHMLKGPYKLPDEYREEVPLSDSDEAGMVTSSPISQETSNANEVMDVELETEQAPSESKD